MTLAACIRPGSGSANVELFEDGSKDISATILGQYDPVLFFIRVGARALRELSLYETFFLASDLDTNIRYSHL